MHAISSGGDRCFDVVAQHMYILQYDSDALQYLSPRAPQRPHLWSFVSATPMTVIVFALRVLCCDVVEHAAVLAIIYMQCEIVAWFLQVTLMTRTMNTRNLNL